MITNCKTTLSQTSSTAHMQIKDHTIPRAIDVALPAKPTTLTGNRRLVVELSPSCTMWMVKQEANTGRGNQRLQNTRKTVLLLRFHSIPSTAPTHPSKRRKNETADISLVQNHANQCHMVGLQHLQYNATANMQHEKSIINDTDPSAIDATLPFNPMTLTGT